MTLDDIKLLYEYNYWANGRILDTAKQVSSDALYKPNTHSWGSLAGTLLHIVDTEYGWRVLLEGGGPTPVLELEEYPTLDSLLGLYQQEEAAMWVYLSRLTDDALNRSRDDTTPKRLLWHELVHVVNHGTQHRSECAVMLTELGHSPGEIDLTEYLDTLE